MKKSLWLMVAMIIFCSNKIIAQSWHESLQKVANSVVSIRVNAVRNFDTENSITTQATGFVVDAKRGIILTNRHVVNPGPISAEAIFSNSEEVSLTPIYRDPVHDFGFFRYDPSQLRFIQPDGLKLADSSAKIGDEIRVIGNDSGEHMSILTGTLARLDRSAPQYAFGSYNDFNTFYFQSAADTSGGSSGSPVVNIHGEVIALNAGGNQQSSSSFFLPLYKITRALKAIQQNKAIERGTLQTTLSYQTYDQVRRLGLSPELEAKFRRHTQGNGLLTVERTVPQGPADNKLRPGDILISVKNKQQQIPYLSRYEEIEIFLDEQVGEEIELTISRQGKLYPIDLTVADLHQITPSEYLEVSGALFNNFSYQLARQTNLPVSGVYLAQAGFIFGNAGVARGTLVHAINETPIADLNDLKRALSQLKQGEYFTVKYRNISSPDKSQVANVKFKTSWHSSNFCMRNDQQGNWSCEPIEWQQQQAPLSASKIKFPKYHHKIVDNIAKSLVLVNADLPYQVDGQNFPNYSGTGLVIDADSGLVVADRNTVPLKMAEVTVTLASALELPAKVLFVHPLHSFVLLQYDASLIKDSPVTSAKLSDSKLSEGDAVWLVGYQTSNRLISEKLSVSSIAPLALPSPSLPQFVESNINAVIVNNPPAIASGVLLDKQGRVRSWWTNFAYGRSGKRTIDRGLPINHAMALKDQWLKQGRISIYSLELELKPISLASAKNYQLTDAWMQRFQHNGNESQVLQVAKTVYGSDTFSLIQPGDLLLSINDKVIGGFDDFDAQTQAPQVKVSVWRDRKQFDFVVNTKQLNGNETDEIYLWAGAILQSPHRAVSAQYQVESKGIYISWYWYGSPAHRYGLTPLYRITEFEEHKIDNLQQFIELSQQYQQQEYVKIRLVDLLGRESIITLKQDRHYWPTQRIFFDGNDWRNQQVSK